MTEVCLFCRVARGDVKVHEVYRDAHSVAFLDHRPIRPGHLQLIPTVHMPYFEALKSDDAARLLHLGQRLARLQKRVLCVPRVGFLFTGSDIPHAHAHLVPLHEKTDVTSGAYFDVASVQFRAAPNPGDAALEAMASRLSEALSASEH